MSQYDSGSADLRAGRAVVYGNSTEWTTYANAGDIFKVRGERTYYSISAVNAATKLTLSAPYTNTDYQAIRSSDTLGTFNNATTIYLGNTSYSPIIAGTFKIKNTQENFTDDGSGTLTGDQGGGGSCTYSDGYYSITLNSMPVASVVFTASYQSGNAVNSMAYQIFSDHTNRFKLPKANTDDFNFPHIYTRAMELIDDKLRNASLNESTASQDITFTNSGYGPVLVDRSNGNLYRLKVSGGSLTASSLA